MKTPFRVTKGRSIFGGASDTPRSRTEQIDRAKNERTTHAKKSSNKTSKEGHHDETTKMERQVLAHERILQALMAYMTESNPHFLERFQKTYGTQINYREQDYTDTEDFAEDFVRAIEQAILRQRTKDDSDASVERRKEEVARMPIVASETVNPERFQIRNRNGIWEVKEHGRFYGDYFKKEQAIDAVRIAKQNRKIYR